MTRYATIVADPPWDYGSDADRWVPNRDRATRRAIPFPSMSVEEVAALPVSGLAAPDSCIWLWTTNRHLPFAFDVLRAWEFEYRQTIVWAKDGVPPFGGAVCANGAEYLLFGRRGEPTVGRWEGNSVVSASRPTLHSRKPDAFLDLIEQVSPGPYLELFSRRARLGWDTWGDEALHGTEAMAV